MLGQFQSMHFLGYLTDIYRSQEPVTSTSASLPLPSSENTPHPQPQALINRPAKAESMSYEAQVARVKSEHEKSIREMKEGTHKFLHSAHMRCQYNLISTRFAEGKGDARAGR